jgi:hypothetical protein
VAANAGGGTVTLWFARFGCAMIPLDIAGHIAHNLFHLLAEVEAVWFTAMPLFGRTAVPGRRPGHRGVAVHGEADRSRPPRSAALDPHRGPVRRRHHMFAVINIGLFAMPMAHPMQTSCTSARHCSPGLGPVLLNWMSRAPVGSVDKRWGSDRRQVGGADLVRRA